MLLGAPLIIPVILSGGSGTRLWPSSRALYPKQLLALASEYSMLQETVLRLSGFEGVSAPIFICNQEHRFIIAEQLQQIGISDAKLILEPEPKNTAPAALIAALYAQQEYGEDVTLLVLPADHLIRDVASFQQAVDIAVAIAKQGYLVTFGVKPLHPETGYGYIRYGESLANQVYSVDSFVEKPNETKANEYLLEGNYLWNSGMFVFLAAEYQREMQQYAPAITSACQLALKSARSDLDFVRLDGEAFALCPSDSIDYAVMEKTKKAAVVSLNAKWSDLGSWSSLWEAMPKDKNDNVLVGDVLTHNVTDCYIRAEHKLVAAVGIKNHVIIETDDAILVVDKNNTQDVKEIVKNLQLQKRFEHHAHSIVYRPWGSYQSLDMGKNFQVKRICVKPGAKLSLQMHYHRAEHWIVVKGTAKVVRGEDSFILTENQSTYISIGQKHRLENPTLLPLEIIEVQSGNYLGEDDIVRFEDDYQRK
ncbi:MAG: mannose-1-phosphate guanylyltransferase/mannose-6-phosphate isomerase [Gammaproteobacteria bacterium]|nr:mannose-1-phosphate guanylyltransferase/mannose-6-phosphate isomerase [Gammaproteobacteria bacterium]